MRTHGEVVQFVKQCVKIEQKGGDVLGYIAKNWPSYSPRATWYNLQRGYLNRKTHQLTEGRPKVKIERKEEEPMKKREDTELLAKAVIQCHQTGGDVRQLLLDRGYKDASAELNNLKYQFKRRNPELYLELKEISLKRVSTSKAEKPIPKPAKAEVGGTLGEPDEDVEVVKHNGKEYEIWEGFEPAHPEYVRVEYREKGASPTCCQPAKPSGVTVPDVLTDDLVQKAEKETMDMPPRENLSEPKHKMLVSDEISTWPTDLQVCGVRSRVMKDSKYEARDVKCVDGGFMSFIWRDLITHAEKELTMSVPQWKMMAAEIKTALKQLGLDT